MRKQTLYIELPTSKVFSLYMERTNLYGAYQRLLRGAYQRLVRTNVLLAVFHCLTQSFMLVLEANIISRVEVWW